MGESSGFASPASGFVVLLVDDDVATGYLLRELMKGVRHPYELHCAMDGVDALSFIGKRRPHLILLDLNMPRMDGLETLAAIKNDPELCVIPVVIFSNSNLSGDVWNSYRGRANGYVQKPIDLEAWTKFIHALEAFWMDFAVKPPALANTMPRRQLTEMKSVTSEMDILQPVAPESGRTIALGDTEEARGGAMHDRAEAETRRSSCEEHNRLLHELGLAVRKLIELHQQQFFAIAEGDSDASRFDLLIHEATEEKQTAKYAYLTHLDEHDCSS